MEKQQNAIQNNILTYIEVTWYNATNHGKVNVLLLRSSLIDLKEKPLRRPPWSASLLDT